MSIRKGDDIIAGTSVGFVRELAWSAKQQITSVPFTAPKDGMIIGACTTDGTGDTDYTDYSLNGAIVGTTHHVLNNYCASANMTIPVKTGDVFTSTDGKWYLPFSALWFVPYEYSGVSDLVMGASSESGMATLTSFPIEGQISWYRVGRIVHVDLATLTVPAQTQDTALATGLPRPPRAMVGTVAYIGGEGTSAGYAKPVAVLADGSLVTNGGTGPAGTLHGGFNYITE